MSEKDRILLFDNWAQNYDPSATSTDEAFPFAGYDRILDEVVRLAEVKPGMRILDLGIGTGNLASRFLSLDCEIWGTDFSSEMLAQVSREYPQIHLVKTNLLEAWPEELNQLYDRVVSAYVFHEFDLAEKINLLQHIGKNHLSPNGLIIIADVAFPNAIVRQEAAQRWANEWDEDEYYWAADEAIAAAVHTGLHMEYKQLSSCGGIFEVSDRKNIS